MMLSAFDFMNALVCCDLEMCKVPVKYMTDTNTYKNKAIFVDDVIGYGTFDFLISVRGTVNKGQSTANLMKMLFKYDKRSIALDVNGVTIDADIMFHEINGDGVDDKGRTSISSFLKVNYYYREETE